MPRGTSGSEDANRNGSNRADMQRRGEAAKGSERAAKVAGAGRSIASTTRAVASKRGRQIF